MQAITYCFYYTDFQVNFCSYIGNTSECLLISSLPGKAERTFVESQGLPSDSTCVLEAEPGKFNIKRCEPGILFISLQLASLFKLSFMALYCRFSCRFNAINDVIQKVQRHDDLIKTHAVR